MGYTELPGLWPLTRSDIASFIEDVPTHRRGRDEVAFKGPFQLRLFCDLTAALTLQRADHKTTFQVDLGVRPWKMLLPLAAFSCPL